MNNLISTQVTEVDKLQSKVEKKNEHIKSFERSSEEMKNIISAQDDKLYSLPKT
jgi:predicted RNase H-like nuclease (RuvC/YqgF family)